MAHIFTQWKTQINYLLFILFFSLVQPQLITPENSAQLNYTHVLFNWIEVTEASSYKIQISSSNTFNSSLIDEIVPNHYYIEKNILEWKNEYYWRVALVNNDGSQENWSTTYSFTIGEDSETFTNDNDPIAVINHNPDLTSNGVVFFGSYINQYSAAIDVDGNEVWNSGSPNSFVYFNYSEDGELLGGKIDEMYEYNSEMYGGVIDTDLNTIFIEDVVMSSIYNDDFIQHEIIKLPNGNYISLAPDIRNLPVSQKDVGSWSWEAQFSTSELESFPWLGDQLVEWDPSTNEILWSMSTFEIYDIDDFDILGGTWQTAGETLPVFDWTHVNAIEFNEVQNAIYISSRHLSKITKIDYDSRQVVWTMGFNQADIFGIENSFSDFYPTYSDGSSASFSFQHGLQVLDNGNIITLDNGNLSNLTWNQSQVNRSRIIEIAVDEQNNSAQLVWEYILPESLYGRLSGNAQKLYNGNYFVTVIADGATSLEISPLKEVVWECKYNLEALEGPIYRAHKMVEVPNACPVTIDECGVCGGDNSSCMGCDNIPNSQVGYDCNDTCGGNEIDCLLDNNLNQPDRIYLLHTFPNPFNPSINIEYSNSSMENISIKVYNLKGEHIETLIESHLSVGRNKVTWNGTNQPAGIYFIRFSSANQITTQKIILLK